MICQSSAPDERSIKNALSLKGNQTKKNEMGGKCGAYKDAVGVPLRRYRPRLEDNIRMDLKSVRTEWTGLIWLVVGASDGLL